MVTFQWWSDESYRVWSMTVKQRRIKAQGRRNPQNLMISADSLESHFLKHCLGPSCRRGRPFYSGLGSLSTEGCYFGNKGHLYHRPVLALWGWICDKKEYIDVRREKNNRHMYKHIPGKLFRSFSYLKLPYYSRLYSSPIYLKEPVYCMGILSKKI